MISEREFKKSIEAIKEAKDMVSRNTQLIPALNAIKSELNQRIKNLSEVLIQDLQNPGFLTQYFQN